MTERTTTLKQETIAAIADVIHRSLDFKTVADSAVEAIITFTPSTCAAVFSLDEVGSMLELVSSSGFAEEIVRTGTRLPVEGSFVGLALQERRVMISEALERETRGVKKMREALLRLPDLTRSGDFQPMSPPNSEIAWRSWEIISFELAGFIASESRINFPFG